MFGGSIPAAAQQARSTPPTSRGVGHVLRIDAVQVGEVEIRVWGFDQEARLPDDPSLFDPHEAHRAGRAGIMVGGFKIDRGEIQRRRRPSRRSPSFPNWPVRFCPHYPLGGVTEGVAGISCLLRNARNC